MGKPPKQFHEGYWYHVYARSLPELRLFETDDERRWFLKKLDEVFIRRKVGLGALCLMDTHYHALVKMGPVRLDRALNGLHMSYAKHLNNERNRRGSVFEKHPGTDIILDDSYLLQLVPYIHNNPVEADLVNEVSEYPWSTDGLYRNGEWEYQDLGSWEWPPHFRDDDRRRTYQEQLGEDVDVPRNKDGYIGTREEWTALEKRDDDEGDRQPDRRDRPAMNEIVEALTEEHEFDVEALKKRGRSQPEVQIRQQAMVEMYEQGYGPVEIGDYFNRDKGTVVHAIQKHRNEGK